MAREDLLICGGERNREEDEKEESHTFFEISLALFFFFFVCGQLNFSRFSQENLSSLSEKTLLQLCVFR
jgi:hypothetical protein